MTTPLQLHVISLGSEIVTEEGIRALYEIIRLNSDPSDLMGDLDHQTQAGPRASGSWAIVAMALVTGALLISPARNMLLYAYPAMAALVALYLYRRNLPGYVTLVCWLWFVTPLIRRILDYKAGWTQPTAVLLGPPLASCVPALWLIPQWRKLLEQRVTPLVSVVVVCLYATGIGLMTYTPRLVFQDLLTWFAPLIFAFMLCWHSERVVELFQAFEKAFLYGTLVISAYGLVQFFLLPKWDAFWMSWVNMDSIGKPLPTEVRVFSTMNGPQILASFLVVGLIIGFTSRLRIRFVAIPLGLLCLALSLARSGWVAMIAGTIYLLFTLPQRQRFRLVLAGVLAAAGMVAALQNPDLQDVMSLRFQSLTDVRNDVSFMDRVDAYRDLFAGLSDAPFGVGMGATPALAEATTRKVVSAGWAQDLGDSTIAMVITTMGLAGTLVLVCYLFPLGRKLLVGSTANTAYMHTMRAVLIALIAEAALDGVVSGPTGFLTWGSVGFCIALSACESEPQPELTATEATA